MLLRFIPPLNHFFRARIVLTVTLGVLSLSVVGCGFGSFQQRDPWREEAEKACIGRKEVKPSVHITRSESIDGPGVCGISYPLKVAALAQGDVVFTSRATLGCPMVSRTEKWLAEIVQPASMLFFGQPVTQMRVGSYACRSRNNQRGAKLSEHSFGNALDIMSFKLADGREITVVKGWKGHPNEQDFLREVFVGACQHFNTVLGPGSDMFHYDHFHIDLARHDARGLRKVCRPVLKYTPQLNNPNARPPAILPLNATPQHMSAAPLGTLQRAGGGGLITPPQNFSQPAPQPVYNPALKSTTLHDVSRSNGFINPPPLNAQNLPMQPLSLQSTQNFSDEENAESNDLDEAPLRDDPPHPSQETGMFEKIGRLFR